MKEFALYSYFRSSASYRVRIALGLKKIDYEYRPVHLLNDGGEQLKSDYAALNPSREVPTLVHRTGGREQMIGQSVAIIDYLDQIVPNPSLFSDQPDKRAQILQACEIVNSGVQPLHNLRVLKRLSEKFNATEEQKNEWTRHWISYGLEALEKFLTPHARDFSFGDRPTAADCFLIPNLANADRFQVDLSPYPTLLRIRMSCDQLTAFVQASPANVPDSPAP
ncbi:MAG: maleylacetoacetate isomerase [Deltaproteobacteria bacterium]|nr:maleylacetoacetate isomerase [Deltaproteobacteria bacterium]